MDTWLLAVNLILLQIPDVVTTNRILAHGGRELNPVMRLCMRMGRGWWAPKLLGTVLGAVYLAVWGEEDGYWMLAGLNGLYVAVVLSNLRQLAKVARRVKACRTPDDADGGPGRTANPATSR